MTSQHYFSRVWLTLSNIITTLVAIGSIIVGILLVKLNNTTVIYTDNTNTTSTTNSTLTSGNSDSVTFRTLIIGIVVIAYGAFLLLGSISGIVGACTKRSRALSFFQCVLIFNLFFVIGGGIFVIVATKRLKDDWQNDAVNWWNQLSGDSRYSIQNYYQCCGVNTGDKLAYLGPPSSTNDAANICIANSAAYPGCEASLSHTLDVTFKSAIGVTIGLALILLSSIVAASLVKKNAAVNEDKAYVQGRAYVQVVNNADGIEVANVGHKPRRSLHSA